MNIADDFPRDFARHVRIDIMCVVVFRTVHVVATTL
jgi:hypothetical protein